MAILSFTINDPGQADTQTVAIQWGDGTSNTISNSSRTAVIPHTYLDDNPTNTAADPLTVIIGVTDKDLGVGRAILPTPVKNVSPHITGITVPAAPLPLGTTANISASFTDPGIQDTHTCTWTWDDTTTSAGTVNSGTSSGSKTYLSAGVYTVKVAVTDDDTGSEQETSQQYIVVYDPSGGFVTGGGWMLSPPGALAANPAMTGKANFGFVSKYKKGANTPEGNTEFQFQAGNVKFNSSTYQWLVIAGARAQYKEPAPPTGAAPTAFYSRPSTGSGMAEAGSISSGSRSGTSAPALSFTTIGWVSKRIARQAPRSVEGPS